MWVSQKVDDFYQIRNTKHIHIEGEIKCISQCFVGSHHSGVPDFSSWYLAWWVDRLPLGAALRVFYHNCQCIYARLWWFTPGYYSSIASCQGKVTYCHGKSACFGYNSCISNSFHRKLWKSWQVTSLLHPWSRPCGRFRSQFGWLPGWLMVGSTPGTSNLATWICVYVFTMIYSQHTHVQAHMQIDLEHMNMCMKYQSIYIEEGIVSIVVDTHIIHIDMYEYVAHRHVIQSYKDLIYIGITADKNS